MYQTCIVRAGLILIVAVILGACSEQEATPSVATTLESRILDGGELFSDAEEQELRQYVDSLSELSGLDLNICTVGDPGEGGLAAYSDDMTARIPLGQEGLNNGAIIYLSDAIREVKIETGHGLEWFVGDTASGMILGEMRPELREGNYASAVEIGLREIVALSEGITWSLTWEQWPPEGPGQLKEGDLIRFSASGLPRSYQEGVPEQVQFHPNYYIMVRPDGTETEVPLYFSGYMRDLADIIVYADAPVKVNAFVASVTPLELRLTGIIE